MTILPYALGICLIAITISMFLCLIRLIIGPSVIDRLLALDTLFLNATCLIIVLGVVGKVRLRENSSSKKRI